MNSSHASEDIEATGSVDGPADRLEKARRIIEERFLAVGTVLAQSIKGIEGLIVSLEKLAATLSSDLVHDTTESLKAAAAMLNALPASNAGRMDNVARLDASRRDLADRIDEMRGNLAYMRAFTVNIKIVASGLGTTAQEFSIFAEDIARCITKGGEELGALESDAGQLQITLEAASEQGQSLSRRIGTLLPRLPDELVHSADAMSRHYRSVADTAGQVTELARDIRKQVSRILLALQVGDITRQRIEHVQKGIRLPQNDERVRADARIASFVEALQADELESAAADFDREVSEINRQMAAMADNARALLKLHSLAFSEGGQDAKGFLHRLGDSLREAQELVESIEEANAVAATTGADTARAADVLSQKVLDIQLLKNDVQYMALNTTLKCCQIGDIGLPLSVVAIALREHANSLETSAEASLSVLERLLEAAHMLAHGETGTATGGEKKDTAAGTIRAAAQQVADAGDKTEADIAVVAAKGDEILHTLESSAVKLDLQHDIGAILGEVAKALGSSRDGLAACPADLGTALQGILADLNKSYTMADEREILKAFATKWQIEAAPEPPPPAQDLDAVLF